jgi:hypothetical protein
MGILIHLFDIFTLPLVDESKMGSETHIKDFYTKIIKVISEGCPSEKYSRSLTLIEYFI